VTNDTEIRTLIRQLLDRSDLRPETVEELQDCLEEIDSKGSLNRMDMDYVQGLTQRLGLKAGGKRGASGRSRTSATPANDSPGNARAPIARARDLVGMLYDPDDGLNTDVSDERASEILEELLQSLNDAEAALPRG